MQDWLYFLETHLSEAEWQKILPIDRMKPLDFEWIPDNKMQFEMIIANAPPNILEGFGFKRYNSLPEPYRYCQERIKTLIGEGFELFMLPSEWYEVIPSDYSVITINAEVISFDPGNSDNTVRSGCLSYGVGIRLPPKTLE